MLGMPQAEVPSTRELLSKEIMQKSKDAMSKYGVQFTLFYVETICV